jgi:hypothetical protein
MPSHFAQFNPGSGAPAGLRLSIQKADSALGVALRVPFRGIPSFSCKIKSLAGIRLALKELPHAISPIYNGGRSMVQDGTVGTAFVNYMRL